MNRVNDFLIKWSMSSKTYIIKNDVSLTYREFFSLIQENKKLLDGLKIRDKNIGLFAGNEIQYIIGYWSILFADSTIFPLNTDLTKRELSTAVSFCDCAWIIVEKKHEKRIAETFLKTEIGIIGIENDFTLYVIKENGSLNKRENSSETALLLQTSGSTDACKTVMLSHRNLISNTYSHVRSIGLQQDDVSLVVLPLWFSYTNTTQLLSQTLVGGSIVLYDRSVFMPKYFCQSIDKWRVSVVSLVPVMLGLLDRYRYLDRYSLKSLKIVCFGSSSPDVNRLRSLMAKLPEKKFIHTYGLTECAPRVTSLLPQYSLKKIGSIGKAIPGLEVQIVENNRVVRPNRVGEIRVRGESVMKGYYKNGEETKAVLKNGWLYTGDLGEYDEEKFIYIVGRKKNIIVSGGMNIYPEEVESLLAQHPSIGDVIVKAEISDYREEVPVVIATLKNSSHLTLESIHRFLEDKLARFKWPKRLYITKRLEKTLTGKVKRSSLYES